VKANEETPNKTDAENILPMRQYSHAQELINNIPYLTMTVLGTIIFLVGFGISTWGLVTAVTYFAYGLVGALWIMIFVCPYCRYFDTRSCPCGYGWIAVKFRKKEPFECFSDKFRKHIPVIVPLWFIPILAGIPLIIRSFSWMMLTLLVVFSLVAFVILPLVSTKHGCRECPQKDSCPWMKRKAG
jgi:hypothetical protein